MAYKELIIDGKTIYYDFPERYPTILFINLDNIDPKSFTETKIIDLEDRIARLLIDYHEKQNEVSKISYLRVNPGQWTEIKKG